MERNGFVARDKEAVATACEVVGVEVNIAKPKYSDMEYGTEYFKYLVEDGGDIYFMCNGCAGYHSVEKINIIDEDYGFDLKELYACKCGVTSSKIQTASSRAVKYDRDAVIKHFEKNNPKGSSCGRVDESKSSISGSGFAAPINSPLVEARGIVTPPPSRPFSEQFCNESVDTNECDSTTSFKKINIKPPEILLRVLAVGALGLVMYLSFPSEAKKMVYSFGDKASELTGNTQGMIKTYMQNVYPKVEVKDVELGRSVGKCVMFSAIDSNSGEKLIGVTTMTGHNSFSSSQADLQILSTRSQEAAENLIYNMCGDN